MERVLERVALERDGEAKAGGGGGSLATATRRNGTRNSKPWFDNTTETWFHVSIIFDFWSQNSKSGAKNRSHFLSDLGPFLGNLGPEKTHFLHWWPGLFTKNSNILGPESNFTPLLVVLLLKSPRFSQQRQHAE